MAQPAAVSDLGLHIVGVQVGARGPAGRRYLVAEVFELVDGLVVEAVDQLGRLSLLQH